MPEAGRLGDVAPAQRFNGGRLEAYVAAYCRRTGRQGVHDWPFYLALSVFRLASISQGVYRRVLAGIAGSQREAVNGAPHLADVAIDILSEGS